MEKSLVAPLSPRFAVAVVIVVAACARPVTPASTPPRSAEAAISAADLRARLFAFADDSMEGREFGRRGNFKATAYLAAEARRIGLAPAGENGTYFQTVPTHRRLFDTTTTLSVAGATFAPWTDFAAFDLGPGMRSLDGVAAVFGGVWGDETRLATGDQVAGKLVVLTMTPGPTGPRWTASRTQLLARFPGAAGIALATLGDMPPGVLSFLREPAVRVGDPDSTPQVPHLWISASAAERLLGRPLEGLAPGTVGRTLEGTIQYRTEPAEYPARNVVALLEGSDPRLRTQYVAIGAHSDHIGIAGRAVDHDSLRAYNTVIRPMGADDPERAPTADEAARIRAIRDSIAALRPPRRDSIANGADDDGSGSVALLEIAEALQGARERPSRSILFVWHTGEEAGLLGAAWYTGHPTVPRDSIVTALNIDMIGRGTAQDVPNGGPGYVQLIGSRRLSRELGDLVETVNSENRLGFRFDYQFDANGHPEQYYCRSDHYEYAKFGIPVTFFSTGSHRDYHMVTDEPQYIDYEQLTRVSTLIHDIAVRVANLDHRPALSVPKPDPEGECVQ